MGMGSLIAVGLYWILRRDAGYPLFDMRVELLHFGGALPSIKKKKKEKRQL